MSLTISRVFCVTVNTDEQPASQPQYVTLLLDTAASTNSLTLDILDEVKLVGWGFLKIYRSNVLSLISEK